jgi:hypothetical protein
MATPIAKPGGGAASSVQIPSGTALSLNAPTNTTTIKDSSGDMRIDLATGKRLKVYANNVLVFDAGTTADQLIVNTTLNMGNNDISGKYMGPANTSQTLTLEGRINAANSVGVRLGQNGTMTAATDRYALSLGKGHDSDDLILVDSYGKFHRPAAVVGTATLVGGTVTVSTAIVRTGDVIRVSMNTPGGTPGFLSAPTGSIVDATSFVINSTSGSDTSTVNYEILTPNVTL